jgi:hypothetical protein
MVTSAWQAEEEEDLDPNAEAGSSGITFGINTHEEGQTVAYSGPNYTGICAVFKAPLQERPSREPFTVAHEIGHTFGLPHNDVGVGDPPMGLMDPRGDGQILLPFTDENLKRLREYDGP